MAARLVHEEGEVKIWSLLGSRDTRRIESMLELYARLFPQYAHYVPRMRRRAEFGEERRAGHVVHYWLVEVDGRPAGLRTFRYVRARHVGLAHALAVDPAYRQVTVGGQRLSMLLVHACLDQIVADARRLGDLPALGMVNEVESPRLLEHYKHNGILELPVKYVEPIFPSEQQGRSREQEIDLIDFEPMFLGFLPDVAEGIRTYTSELIANFSLAFLVDHYGLPVEHPQVQAVLDSIPVMS
jgi:GNAT superfamily N-acetyltransferase